MSFPQAAVNHMLSHQRHMDMIRYTVTYRTPNGQVRSKDIEAIGTPQAIQMVKRMIAKNGYWGVTLGYHDSGKVLLSFA